MHPMQTSFIGFIYVTGYGTYVFLVWTYMCAIRFICTYKHSTTSLNTWSLTQLHEKHTKQLADR